MNVAPEYIVARRVLLDALVALEGHLDNLILVGAQAVYHHTGDADLNVPPLTTDADLAINTRNLGQAPEIGSVLRAAGFTPGPNPGHWVNVGDVAVDLMVVPHQAGTTRATARAARLAPHEKPDRPHRPRPGARLGRQHPGHHRGTRTRRRPIVRAPGGRASGVADGQGHQDQRAFGAGR